MAITTGTAILAGTLGAAGIGASMYQSSQQKKAASKQMEEWSAMVAPQKRYMRQLYPLQLRQAEAYTPYYEDVIAQKQRLLPYTERAVEDYFFPMMGQTFEAIQDYASPDVMPWERAAVSRPYERARTRLGERAAGAGMMRSGPVNKLATLYDIAEAEALTKLPYQRRREAVDPMLRFLGYQPSPASVGMPSQIGINIPGMPSPYTPEGIDSFSLGKLLGKGLLGGKTTGVPTDVETMSAPYGYEL